MQTRKPAQNAPHGPDFRHVETWVFDLDNTLYPFNPERVSIMEERICLFVQRHFGIAREPAWKIQKRYLEEHGSTLGGLVKHHGIDADVYHDFVNDVDALDLTQDAELRAAVARVAGRRLVFTNNCGRFAAEVLRRIGVDDLFHDIIDARATQFIPKPQAPAYEVLVARGAAPESAVLFDDNPRNLAPAHALGMTTVWLNRACAALWKKPGVQHIHYEISDLAPFLHTLRI